MSVSHCMSRVLAIGVTRRDSWGDQIAALPDACVHADCGEPRSCRQRAADYLRVQYRVQQRAERKAGAA